MGSKFPLATLVFESKQLAGTNGSSSNIGNEPIAAPAAALINGVIERMRDAFAGVYRDAFGRRGRGRRDGDGEDRVCGPADEEFLEVVFVAC